MKKHVYMVRHERIFIGKVYNDLYGPYKSKVITLLMFIFIYLKMGSFDAVYWYTEK